MQTDHRYCWHPQHTGGPHYKEASRLGCPQGSGGEAPLQSSKVGQQSELSHSEKWQWPFPKIGIAFPSCRQVAEAFLPPKREAEIGPSHSTLSSLILSFSHPYLLNDCHWEEVAAISNSPSPLQVLHLVRETDSGQSWMGPVAIHWPGSL